METTNEPVCCPKFDPIPWENMNFEWKEKIFVKSSVFCLFYLPMNFGFKMKKLDKIISRAGADWSEGICLSDQTSKWNMDLFISVDKPVRALENVIFRGKFFSKVYEGAFRDVGKWMVDFTLVLAEKDFGSSKIYTWYTTCPKCAKKYGKNYVVMIAKVE